MSHIKSAFRGVFHQFAASPCYSPMPQPPGCLRGTSAAKASLILASVQLAAGSPPFAIFERVPSALMCIFARGDSRQAYRDRGRYRGTPAPSASTWRLQGQA